MSVAFVSLLTGALACALFAIATGRNLSRALVAAMAFVVLLSGALALAGAGLLAWVVVIPAATAILMLQLFGWMLVDVDRDHVPATDRGTAMARGLAFALVAVGLGLLGRALLGRGELFAPGLARRPDEVVALGVWLFGAARELVALMGFAIAAGLLSALLLLRDDGRA